MTAQDNVATYRRWFDEGWSRGKVGLVDEMYSPDYVTHSIPPEFAPNRDGLKTFLHAFRGGMPDLRITVEDVVAQGDRVAGRLTGSGTHTGNLFGIPPTGKKIAVGIMIIARFDDTGKWIEDWANWDQLGMMQQLGVIPAPAAA